MQDQRSPIEGVRRALGQRILINQHWRGNPPHVIRGEANLSYYLVILSQIRALSVS